MEGVNVAQGRYLSMQGRQSGEAESQNVYIVNKIENNRETVSRAKPTTG